MLKHEVVVQLTGATTTKAGLRINAELSKNQNLTNVKVSAEEIATVDLELHEFHRGHGD
jgi:3-polyprenyl-4-hydroxybenzoate decarboxylase